MAIYEKKGSGRSERQGNRTQKASKKKDSLVHLNLSPMLCTLVEEPFNKKGWFFELKWDGYRTLAVKDKEVELFSRNRLSFNKYFPTIISEIKKIPGGFVLDGEVVVLDDEGKPSFQLLQNYLKTRVGVPIYYVFDILSLNNKSFTDLSFVDRREILNKLLSKVSFPHIKISEAIEEKGKELFKIASKEGLEGIVAKNGESTYQHGRSHDWQKIKTHQRQEVVIGGFTEPRGSRQHFGALLVGVNTKEGLQYVGHVGGGFNQALLKEIYGKLHKIETKACPFFNKPKANTSVVWVKPQLVCEVVFAEWTADDIMRQPIFKGLRIDKKASEVVMEKANKKGVSVSGKSKEDFEISNLDKLYWKKEKITKGDLIEYYRTMSKFILPYLHNRPLMMHRFPGGFGTEGFYQKEAGEHIPSFVKTVAVEHEEGKVVHYIVVEDEKSLLYVVNLGSIELHPFVSSYPHLYYPDFTLIDLDPEDVDFEVVIECAQQVHEVLESAEVPHYCKTSGSRGLHILIPMHAKYDMDQSKDFAQLVATLVNNVIPDITSLERSPKKRQKRVYLDYLQNRWGQTMACPYSVRARELATVSTPLEWKEVKGGLDPRDFTIHTVPKRVKKIGDVFAGVLKKGINLKTVLKKLEVLV